MAGVENVFLVCHPMSKKVNFVVSKTIRRRFPLTRLECSSRGNAAGMAGRHFPFAILISNRTDRIGLFFLSSRPTATRNLQHNKYSSFVLEQHKEQIPAALYSSDIPLHLRRMLSICISLSLRCSVENIFT